MKPKVKLSDKDGNVFNLVGICSKALKNAGKNDEVGKMHNRNWNKIFKLYKNERQNKRISME